MRTAAGARRAGPPRATATPKTGTARGLGAAPLSNRQDAATLWYHDHAIGIERLNQYAGLVGMYLVRDELRTLGFGAAGAGSWCSATGCLTRGQSSTRLPARQMRLIRSSTVTRSPSTASFIRTESARTYRFGVPNASTPVLSPVFRTAGGLPLHAIGTDRVSSRDRRRRRRPAERADLVVDFSPLAWTASLRSQSLQLLQFRVRRAAGRSAPLLRATRSGRRSRRVDGEDRTLTNQYWTGDQRC